MHRSVHVLRACDRPGPRAYPAPDRSQAPDRSNIDRFQSLAVGPSHGGPTHWSGTVAHSTATACRTTNSGAQMSGRVTHRPARTVQFQLREIESCGCAARSAAGGIGARRRWPRQTPWAPVRGGGLFTARRPSSPAAPAASGAPRHPPLF